MAEEKRNTGKTYIVSKRESDGKWQLKYTGGERVIKLFDTDRKSTRLNSRHKSRSAGVRKSTC